MPEEIEVEVTPYGSEAAAVEAAARTLLASPALAPFLSGTRHRLLSFTVDEQPMPGADPSPPGRFVATIYDYTNDRGLGVRGSLATLQGGAGQQPEVLVLSDQPLPSEEEFRAAVAIVRKDAQRAAGLDAGTMQAYRAMPPLVPVTLPDGRMPRTVTVGLLSAHNFRHEILGIDLIDEQAASPEEGQAPAPSNNECGPPPKNGCPWTGSAGQAWITISSGGTEIWRLLVVRAASSSGTNGSGVELRYVDYKGHRVLRQAHAPILNVEYAHGGAQQWCGPTYRDWLNEEACFNAPPEQDLAPGIRMCSAPPSTILDSGSDDGDFRGVAIYPAADSVLLVSELAAGWYRYVSEWRLHLDGSIAARFGFAAVDNPCTCHPHTHHVYWRLDFDVGQAGNSVDEFNQPPLSGSSQWHTLTEETRRTRDPGRSRHWRIRNEATSAGYLLMPGEDDGVATAYGVGDLWALLYHPDEIDDGQGFTTAPGLSRARVHDFVKDKKPIVDADVVVWYAGHFAHTGDHQGHWVGPTLSPVNWPGA